MAEKSDEIQNAQLQALREQAATNAAMREYAAAAERRDAAETQVITELRNLEKAEREQTIAWRTVLNPEYVIRRDALHAATMRLAGMEGDALGLAEEYEAYLRGDA